MSDPASQVLQHYAVRLSAVSLSEESVDLLLSESLISKETKTEVESIGGFLVGDSLREIRSSVTEDHNKLKSLGLILLKSHEAKPVALDILQECGKTLLIL